MDPKRHAIRVGTRRGWTEFKQSIKSPQDQGFYLFTALITLLYLFINRNDRVEGSEPVHAGRGPAQHPGSDDCLRHGYRAGVHARDGARGWNAAPCQGGAERLDRSGHGARREQHPRV